MFRFILFVLSMYTTLAHGVITDFRSQLDRVTTESVKKIETKHKVTCCGGGGGTMHGVESVFLSFQVEGHVSIDQARCMIVDAVEVYQQTINNNLLLRPYLLEYPFPLTRIKMVFFVDNSDDAAIKLFALSATNKERVAKIEYAVSDHKNMHKKVLEETFEEAKEQLRAKM